MAESCVPGAGSFNVEMVIYLLIFLSWMARWWCHMTWKSSFLSLAISDPPQMEINNVWHTTEATYMSLLPAAASIFKTCIHLSLHLPLGCCVGDQSDRRWLIHQVIRHVIGFLCSMAVATVHNLTSCMLPWVLLVNISSAVADSQGHVCSPYTPLPTPTTTENKYTWWWGFW